MSVNTSDPAGEVTRHLRGLEARGSRGLVAQLIDSLMGETSGQLEAVRKAAANGDREALYRAAHSLQGSVAIVGADSVARSCAELVKTARKGSFEQVTPIVKQVETGIHEIRKALVGWTETSPAGAAAFQQRTYPPTGLGRKRVLVIDDDDGIRKITQMLVEGLGHDVEAAPDGIEGLAKLQLGVDLVLLDVVMPGLDGFDVCRRIRQDPAGCDVPVIMVTSLATLEHRLHAVEAGANDFIAKPVDETELRVRATSLLKLKATQDELKRYHAHLETMCEERTASLRKALEHMAEAQRTAYQAQLETVERLAILAEYKDKVTARHIQRMSEYSAVLARGLNLPAAEVELILHASRMHDVGKIAVPEAILRKPSELDSHEWKVMRQHSAIGSRILEDSSSQILQAGRVIALHHHERWDGGGYPAGLSGSDIPLWGRICAVADVFDAVTSEGPYKPAFPNEEALQLLRDGKGKHFDPRVVDVFFKCLDDILEIQEKFKDG
ncbi:MAG TPA: HD domain-containing phosphohydrolase [Vicinamibacterales bacterium]|nr:HD domain-containing phosphohydrolase [Vicinamibacterales bacterium]